MQEKRAFQENVLGHLRSVLPARAEAAADASNRNGTQSAYWLTDILGWTGKGGVTINTGDTYANVLVLPPPGDSDGEAAIDAANARFGL